MLLGGEQSYTVNYRTRLYFIELVAAVEVQLSVEKRIFCHCLEYKEQALHSSVLVCRVVLHNIIVKMVQQNVNILQRCSTGQYNICCLTYRTS